jgi:hypothetical protein
MQKLKCVNVLVELIGMDFHVLLLIVIQGEFGMCTRLPANARQELCGMEHIVLWLNNAKEVLCLIPSLINVSVLMELTYQMDTAKQLDALVVRLGMGLLVFVIQPITGTEVYACFV